MAQDGNGRIISQMAGKGRIKSTDIDKVLGTFLDTSVFLCSDTATNYKKFAKDKVFMRRSLFITFNTLMPVISDKNSFGVLSRGHNKIFG